LLFIYAVRWWWYVLYIVASSEKEIDAPFGFLVREFVYLFLFRMDGRRYSLRVNYTRVDSFSRIACTYISGIFGLGRGVVSSPFGFSLTTTPLDRSEWKSHRWKDGCPLPVYAVTRFLPVAPWSRDITTQNSVTSSSGLLFLG
jgi:hypothetical protein